MNRLFFLIFLSLSLFAQEKKIDYVNEISVMLGDSENGFIHNIGRSTAYEMQFQYNGLDFPIKPEISFVYSNSIPLYTTGQTSYTSIMVNGVYELDYSDLITPYIKGGTGYSSFSDVPDAPPNAAFLDTGAGVKLHLTDRWALKFEVNAAFGADYFNLLATGGLNFAFGRKYVAPPPEKVCEPCPVVEPVIIIKKEIAPTLNIEFAFAKVKVTDQSRESIKSYAKDLNSEEHQDKHILIVGYTDAKGAKGFNATLSLRRAVAVREQFIANDVDPKRITIDGHGENDPIASNKTTEGRKQNRHVVVIVQDPEVAQQ